MITIGSTVKVIRMPIDNEYWNVPFRTLGKVGVVTDITENQNDGGRIYVTFGRDCWYFPRNQNVLELYSENKWNKLNYVSPFKPLKLP